MLTLNCDGIIRNYLGGSLVNLHHNIYPTNNSKQSEIFIEFWAATFLFWVPRSFYSIIYQVIYMYIILGPK